MLNRFAPPASLNDLGAEHAAGWNAVVKSFFAAAKAGHPQEVVNDAPRGQFYDPTETPTADDATEAEITWSAFPRQVRLTTGSDEERWKQADSDRGFQDEYCEWSVERDDDNKIQRVTFTCEPPEYWWFMGAQPDLKDKVLRLYQQYISPQVQYDDLFNEQGRYVPDNQWNSTTENGAMHLITAPNSLNAEIELAAAATIVRDIPDKGTLTGEQELIHCGRYGVETRNSDPHIGGEVNKLAQQKADITLKDPVGLYMKGLATVSFETPDGADAQAFWKPVRGGADHTVRAVFEVPDDKDYKVGDILIEGQKIRWGAQLTDFITMRLTGVACRIGQSTFAPMNACVARRRIAGRASLAAVSAPPELPGFLLGSRLTA
jgi:hypothetical protein